MKFELISVPYSLGRERQGMGAGPDRLVSEGILEQLRSDGHEVTHLRLTLEERFRNEIGATFSLNRSLARAVAGATKRRALPVVLAGNCLAAQGILASTAEPVGVVWLDAHGDFNTPETTISGYLDGMALAAVNGHCFDQLARSVGEFRPIPEEHVLLIGARALDPLEAQLLARSRVFPIAPGELQRLPQAMAHLQSLVQSVYLHVDFDVLDPSEGQANEYAEAGGLSAQQLEGVVGQVARHFQLFAVAFAAYDPAFDPDGRIAKVASRIVRVLLETLS